MNAQAALFTERTYASGADWCYRHEKAATYLADRARFINVHKKARIAPLMEELLAHPRQFGLDMRDDGSPYLASRNLWPEIARYLMASQGVTFTLRRASCDAGYTEATP